jgi:hypothetical protein
MTDETTNDVDLKTALESIRVTNKEAFIELQKKGVTLDPVGILMTRLNTFIEFCLNDSPEHALYFELLFEEAIGKQLKDGLSEVNRAILLEGVNGVGTAMNHPLL